MLLAAEKDPVAAVARRLDPDRQLTVAVLEVADVAELQIEPSSLPCLFEATAEVGIVHAGCDLAEEVQAKPWQVARAGQPPLRLAVEEDPPIVRQADRTERQAVDLLVRQALDPPREVPFLEIRQFNRFVHDPPPATAARSPRPRRSGRRFFRHSRTAAAGARMSRYPSRRGRSGHIRTTGDR